MKASFTQKPNWLWALSIPALIFISCFLITFSAKYQQNTGILSNAILFDLLITAPLVYLFAIRNTTISKLRVIRVFVVGILFAGIILKSSSNSYLHIIKTWISPIIELAVIAIVIRKFLAANREAKSNADGTTDFLFHCRNVASSVIGSKRAGNILGSEIAVFYYAFIARKNKMIDQQTTFSNYRERGSTPIFWAIMFIFLVETAGMHFLMANWNLMLAWIITGLSIYTCLQLFAHMRAVKARAITINQRGINVRNGLAGDAYIEFENIREIQLSKKYPDHEAVKIALFSKLESHNIVVHLNEPITVTKIFGITKKTSTILFFVDSPKKFLAVAKMHAGDKGE